MKIILVFPFIDELVAALRLCIHWLRRLTCKCVVTDRNSFQGALERNASLAFEFTAEYRELAAHARVHTHQDRAQKAREYRERSTQEKQQRQLALLLRHDQLVHQRLAMERLHAWCMLLAVAGRTRVLMTALKDARAQRRRSAARAVIQRSWYARAPT